MTVVHISGDGFVRWTALHKHIPEVQTWSIFQRRALRLKSALFRFCRVISTLWNFTSLTLGICSYPQTHGFFIVLTKAHFFVCLLCLCLNQSVTLSCGCTWPIRFQSYALCLAILNADKKFKLRGAVIFAVYYCPDSRISKQHGLYWGYHVLGDELRVYLSWMGFDEGAKWKKSEGGCDFSLLNFVLSAQGHRLQSVQSWA